MTEKEFPEGMVPLGSEEFNFDCHPGVECFTVCCNKVDITLYPYDVILLKNGLKMDSEQFVRDHTFLVKAENPFFPSVKLKLSEDDSCPFLTTEGCSVYSNRPSACRTYPLERAVDRSAPQGGMGRDFYFMTNHDYCLGHREQQVFTVNKWIRNQRLFDCNTMNTLWAEVDTLFGSNPWKGEGAGGEKQQIAFMVCYNIDGFRRFSLQHGILKQYKLAKDHRRRIENEDSELLKFGFEWLKNLLGAKNSLVKK
ncbi:MAG: YkgJ family cysteine cluster protein [Desulforhopalus sp.]